MVDETKTAFGITGKMWGHEHWYLGDATPDVVTFGGKSGLSGFYTSLDFRRGAGSDHGLNFERAVDTM